MGQIKKPQDEVQKRQYPHFARINGEHPFKTQVPEGRVEYKARYKKGGKVAFFNFELAKEMGLIPKTHTHQLNADLEREILETFSLVIINEYDLINNIQFPEDEIHPNTYMATRYLQLQHPDKTGRTSGDGRTAWNGTVRSNGVSWDISSCGTGATKLSPACNINKKFYQTGDPEISYGCGLSEVSEGLETLFFSEVFHRNGLPTERVLAIIEYDKGLAINVRAYPNLIRPSHFFCHLKQGNHKALKQVTDYYISRQVENKKFPDVTGWNATKRYFGLADQVARDFANIAARFEDDYIFCWLDWDGDNILMDGGIIDYGSIRQFGLFHAEYRFDDVERFSTTILEQRLKARYIVQCFAQIADYLVTGKKRPLSQFKNHQTVKNFDKYFQEAKNRNILEKMGLKEKYQDFLLEKHLPQVETFRKAFSFFEREKSKRGMYKVADGITRDAIFCMRDLLRELPQMYLARQGKIAPQEFIEIMKSSYAKKRDLTVNAKRLKYINQFQKSYWGLVEMISKEFHHPTSKILLETTMRSSVINKYDRVTGNSISFVVEKVGKSRPKLNAEEVYQLMNEFRNYQNLDPDHEVVPAALPVRHQNLLRGFHSIVRENREGI